MYIWSSPCKPSRDPYRTLSKEEEEEEEYKWISIISIISINYILNIKYLLGIETYQVY